MKRLILIAAIFLTVCSGAATLLVPSLVSADTKSEICGGIQTASGTSSCSGGVNLTNVIRNVINVFSWIIGVVAVIMIMVAGFKYITSGGDSGNITSAKNTIIYAIIGLVVVALSQSIVWFVLDRIK
jgi:hypothetical protein